MSYHFPDTVLLRQLIYLSLWKLSYQVFVEIYYVVFSVLLKKQAYSRYGLVSAVCCYIACVIPSEAVYETYHAVVYIYMVALYARLYPLLYIKCFIIHSIIWCGSFSWLQFIVESFITRWGKLINFCKLKTLSITVQPLRTTVRPSSMIVWFFGMMTWPLTRPPPGSGQRSCSHNQWSNRCAQASWRRTHGTYHHAQEINNYSHNYIHQVTCI